MKDEQITINEPENEKASFNISINNTNHDDKVDNNPIKSMRCNE